MTHIIIFTIIALIVGVVTAGLKIQFDRFFAIILLASLMKLSITEAVNVFLWIIFLSAGYVIWKNREKIKKMPSANKKKFITLVPVLSFAGVYVGSALFSLVSNLVLSVTLGVLAVLYGLRLVFIHFKPYELEYKNEKPIYQKICGLFGPIVSGFFAGFIGTTLKPLKIPFAVKIGKMNMGQVYLGNTITALYSSIFAILLHSFYTTSGAAITVNNIKLGISLWLAIHMVFELTQMFFKERWKKPFQIFIGLVLIIVAFRFF
jgi:uncharacterized membrane protein YfcA